MSVPAAYIAVILIWTTTPLAVKWSGEGPGFLLGALGRMGLAAVVCVLLLMLLRIPFAWHRAARRAYVAASIAVYGAMLCVYWAAQHVPSGLISVLFGLTPLLTALFERWLLDQRGYSLAKLGGTLLGIAGLMVIFGGATALGPSALEGMGVLLLGVLINAFSMVLLKRYNASLAPFAVATGSLVIGATLLLLTWLAVDGALPPAPLPAHATASILYLGLVGSVLGFPLFYYLLKRTPASAVALLMLLTPVTALLLGNAVNHEPITPSVWAGTALVLAGLAVHQWGPAPPIAPPGEDAGVPEITCHK